MPETEKHVSVLLKLKPRSRRQRQLLLKPWQLKSYSDREAKRIRGESGGESAAPPSLFGNPQEKDAFYGTVEAVAAAERTGFEAAVQAATRTHAYRDNDRLLVQQPRLAAALWARVQMFVPGEIDGRRPIGLNKAVRIYRYGPGQRFGQHIDGSVQCPETGAWSEYTVLVYLNGGGDDELRGGETTFWKGTGKKQTVALSFPPARGACLLHGHGHRCLLHAGEEVQRGVKYLLRSDVMYG